MKKDESDEMRDEYDFSNGRRGMFVGLIEKGERKEPVETLAVCIKSEDFMNLIPRKIYNVTNYDNELIKWRNGRKSRLSDTIFSRADVTCRSGKYHRKNCHITVEMTWGEIAYGQATVSQVTFKESRCPRPHVH